MDIGILGQRLAIGVIGSTAAVRWFARSTRLVRWGAVVATTAIYAVVLPPTLSSLALVTLLALSHLIAVHFMNSTR